MFNGKSHSNEQDAHFLREALLEAEKRKGFTSPNPAVGAVLVREGEVIGRGSHWAAGYPHAEVEVLKGVAEEPGATLYVTLEPCCHFGKKLKGLFLGLWIPTLWYLEKVKLFYRQPE
jgi:pyrimidine deaminase RibD-like protein